MEQGSLGGAWGDAAAASKSAEDEEVLARLKEQRPDRFFKENLAVTLSSADLAKRGQELESTLTELESTKDELRSFTTKLKERIALIDDKKEHFRVVVRTGVEQQPVDVRETFEFETNTVRRIRMDTLEQISERAMTAAERQPMLPGIPDDQAESAGEDEEGISEEDDDLEDDADEDNSED